MCRLFGFRSKISLTVHHSLVKAKNALSVQSQAHPDGWGLGYYEGAEARVVKNSSPAFESDGFNLLSQMISCSAFIAHVRKATVGKNCIYNTHPFKHHEWLFAHNGNIEGFTQLRPYFLEEISPAFRDQLQGSTDSEHCFYLFLTELDRSNGLRSTCPKAVLDALSTTMERINQWAQILDTEPPILNFLVTNGPMLATTRFGRRLFYSTQKKSCSDFSICPSAAKPCLGLRIEEGPLTHLCVSSEPTCDEDIWEEVPDNSALLIDQDMILHRRENILEHCGERERSREKFALPAPVSVA